MGSNSLEKPHIVLVPFPAQGHVTPFLKLAKLLHSKGFHITFVNTEFNHNHLLKSQGPAALDGLPDFRFEAIPDGLPPSDDNATQNVPPLCDSTTKNCLAPFRDLLLRLNDRSSGVPPVSCVITDGIMSFALDAAQELGIPDVLFWTPSACGFMAYLHYHELIAKGLVPLKDVADFSNGYLDTPINWIPGLKNMRLKDIPSFIRTTDRADIMLNFFVRESARASMPLAIILNTFDDIQVSSKSILQPKEKVFQAHSSTRLNYLDQFPEPLHPWIVCVKDVLADGNCEYRAIVSLLSFGETG